jgi:hypothetical protein
MPSVGREQLDDQLDHLLGGVELAALLAGVVGELLDQVLVGAAEHVGLGEVGVAQVTFEKCCTSRPRTASRFLASPSLRSSLKSMPASTPSSEPFSASSAEHALLSVSPMLVAVFWISDQRARSGHEELVLVLVRVLGVAPSATQRARTPRSKRSERRLRNSIPKMKFL